MKTILTLTLLTFYAFSYGQTNLLDFSGWTTGTGSTGIFTKYGSESESVRELGFGPFSQTEQVLLWKAKHDPTTTSNSGGWTTSSSAGINVTSTQTYRLTLWLKMVNSQPDASFFGFTSYDSNGQVLSTPRVGSSSTNNPYFGATPPTLNEWYFFVAYIHPTGSGVTTASGQIWDTSGNLVGALTDYIFPAGTAYIRHKANSKNTAATTGDEIHYYAPTMYDTANMPPIEVLRDGVDPNAGGNSGPSLWTQSGNNISYNNGNVGIGTNSPNTNLHVSGGTGDAELLIQADTDNVNEDDNPFITLSQDNGGSQGFIGLNSNTKAAHIDKYPKYVNNAEIRDYPGTLSNYLLIGTNDDKGVQLGSDGSVRLTVHGNGNVGIGTTDPGTWQLAVNGKIRAKEIKVETANWPDYVFSKNYNLPTLEELAQQIKEKGHLPSLPSATEAEKNGILLGEMNRLLLEKIEELTLYTIQQEQKIKAQEERLVKIEALLSKEKN